MCSGRVLAVRSTGKEPLGQKMFWFHLYFVHSLHQSIYLVSLGLSLNWASTRSKDVLVSLALRVVFHQSILLTSLGRPFTIIKILYNLSFFIISRLEGRFTAYGYSMVALNIAVSIYIE